MLIKRLSAAALVALAFSGPSQADVLSVCAEDITTFCNDVVPGDGRIAACLYAYGGHVSDACFAETEPMDILLERVFDRVAIIGAACGEDIAAHCADVKPGGGNYIQCLSQKKTEISAGCASELPDFASAAQN